MSSRSFADSEIRKIEKLKKYQLPHSFKKIGFGIFIVSFVAMFAIAFTTNNLDAREISKYGILFGLLIISISKEKIEDEFIIKMRMQSYTLAFILGVLYALVLPFVDFIVDFIFQSDKAEVKDVGDFVILWMLLFVQVFFFHLLKRGSNEE